MRCCLRSIFGGIILGIVVIVVAAVAAYFLIYPRIDSALADAVRREYMLPPSAAIKFKHGTLLDTYEGKLQSFQVEAKEAKLEGLLINDVKLYATGIQFDMTRTLITGEAELKKVEHARLKFRVSEQSLADHWSETLASRGIRDVDVDLRDKEIAVSGNIDLKLTKLPVAARGVFEADGSQKIRMKVNELSLGGNKFDPAGISDLVSKLTFGKAKLDVGEIGDVFSKSIRTPVIDLGDLQMGVDVTRLEPRSGYLYIEAESANPSKLAAALKKAKAENSKTGESQPDRKSEADKIGDAVKQGANNFEKLGGKLKKIIK
jgi:hypothetical protein